MASVYSMCVDWVGYDPFDEWDEERGEHVEYGCVHFLPASERHPPGEHGDFLTLSRERGVGGYVGPVTISVDGAGAEGGIVLAELSRGALRLVLDADAAASIEDDEVRVEFQLDDAPFARLRAELAELLGEWGVLRVAPDAEPGAAADGGGV